MGKDLAFEEDIFSDNLNMNKALYKFEKYNWKRDAINFMGNFAHLRQVLKIDYNSNIDMIIKNKYGIQRSCRLKCA
jgi:hypothetical protein